MVKEIVEGYEEARAILRDYMSNGYQIGNIQFHKDGASITEINK